MENKVYAATLFLIVVLSSCSRQPAVREVHDGPGLVEGTVIYENGQPAKGATVSASPLDVVVIGKVPSTNTDELGHFYIKHLWLGKFVATAKKEDEGYPDTFSSFYSNSKMAPITLSLSHLAATETVILGPKAGILVGSLTDAVNGTPLNACVDFRRASNPNNFLSSGLDGAKYRILVPADREVMMKIWFEGHLPWYYPGANTKSEAKTLRLKPGEQKVLNIRLQRGENPAEAGCETHICFPLCKPWN